MGKLDTNKKIKRDSLLDTAFRLFMSQGISKTSISDIVDQAGVAKGIFISRTSMIYTTSSYATSLPSC